MSKYKIVLTGKTWPKAFNKIKEHCEVKVWEKDESMPRDLLFEWLQNAEGLFSTNDIIINDELLSNAPNLRVIVQSSVGYDNIDINACNRRGILVGNTQGVLVDATANLTFGLLLTATRKIHEGWNYVKTGKWEEEGSNSIYGIDLKDKILGIVGMGAIGSEVAKRAQAFGINVIYYNRNKRKDEKSLNVKYELFDDLLIKSDFVISLVPLKESSKNLFGYNQFSMMKSTSYFINASRGGVVDTKALYDALKKKEIAYAALDVIDTEPISGKHQLLTLPNILITPHIGSATIETRNKMADLSADNLLAGLKGEPLLSCVNPL